MTESKPGTPDPSDRRTLLNAALAKLEQMQARLDAAERRAREPIAIVGMGCRFPGADDLSAFWNLLRDGRDGTSDVPPDRWDAQAFYDPDPDVPGKMYSTRAGFIHGLDQFDPHFFGISPREAAGIDPQQRLVLEVAWEALEHAGIAPPSLRGTSTGAFIGIGSSDFAFRRLGTGAAGVDAYTGSGAGLCFAAGRLSYVLGLQGPSMSVDTACSSSLLAVHLACQSLRLGECRAAIAGGVNVMLSPSVFIYLSKARALSASGLCRAFDAEADGFVRGEGCGLVVLKRLSDALADGERILAVIPGSAVNQDGPSSGLTVPNGPAQQALVTDAIQRARIAPGDVSYIETHGTGTSLGDPIEANALCAALGAGRTRENPLIIGSVKTNIGHLEAAAGVAGLIKVVLALQHEIIPAHLHFSRLNEHIRPGAVTLEIPAGARRWPKGTRPRIAGVSSFGLSGTNAHVLVAEAPAPTPLPAVPARPVHVITMAARDERALGALMQAHHARREAADETPADLALSANTGRAHLAHRIAIQARSHDEFRERLASAIGGSQPRGVFRGQGDSGRVPRVAFLFTGQGSQYAGMARELYATEPVFRTTLDDCDRRLQHLLKRPLLSVLFAEGDDAALIDQTQYTQPALFALEYALAAMWRAWGVEPAVVLGHSVGEYVAASVAGALSVEDALSLLAERARLMQALPADGAMAAVVADETVVRQEVAREAADVSIAAFNAPGNIVVSGRRAALDRLLARIEQRGATAKRLTVSHAFHSPQVEPMLDAFEQAARRLEGRVPVIPLIANLTGAALTPSDRLDATYWRRHAREAVQFERSIRTLESMDCDVWLELGPSPVLLGLARRCAQDWGGSAVPSLRQGKGDWEQLTEALGTLYAAGLPIKWAAVHAGAPGRRVPLATYPFQREHCWPDDLKPIVGDFASVPARASGHPLLGARLRSPLVTAQFENAVEATSPAYLGDHAVHGTPVFPAAAYIEMALGAAREALGGGPVSLDQVSVIDALRLSAGEQTIVQTIVSETGDRAFGFRVLSTRASVDGETWHEHATGTIRHDGGAVATAPALDEVKRACPESLEPVAFYERASTFGMEYGPSFQAIQELWRGDRQALGHVVLPGHLSTDGYVVHPVLLDGALQVLGAAVESSGVDGDAYLPVGCGRVGLAPTAANELWSHAVVKPAADGEVLIATVTLYGSDGRSVGSIEAMQLKRVRESTWREQNADETDRCLYEVRWEPLPSIDETSDAGTGTWAVRGSSSELTQEVVAILGARGAGCVLVEQGAAYAFGRDRAAVRLDEPQDYQQLIADLRSNFDDWRGIVELEPAEAIEPDEAGRLTSADALGRSYRGLLPLVQGLIASEAQGAALVVATRGAQPQGDGRITWAGVEQSAAIGLARTAATEHPTMVCRRVDLDPSDSDRTSAAALVSELLAKEAEEEVAYRNGVRHGRRLTRARRLESGGPPTSSANSQLQIPQRGVLENLERRPVARREPAAGEIEIRVEATGLNFRDVLNALGMYPGEAGLLGCECAGVVSAVGDGVATFEVGDPVMALATGSFARYVTTPAVLAMRRPAGVSPEAAVTIPNAFLTAAYALERVAHIARGERVLIHAAAGGVGLAAVQIAARAGAEVFATAGNERKREYLTSIGVAHVFDSRSLAFADQITDVTRGVGIDIVLNSLAGEFIPKSLGLLREGGRFLELGKTGIWDDHAAGELNPRARYSVIDIGEAIAHDLAGVRATLDSIMRRLDDGTVAPLPFETFPGDRAVDAFRHMAMAKHVGKVVVTAEPARAVGAPVRADATYLVSGGLGALGLASARWLADQGARSIVLVGRRPPRDSARGAVEDLERRGIRVTVLQADISSAGECERIASVLARLAPLKGIIHAAGVVDDAMLAAQSWERWRQVAGPKVDGAVNLLALDQSRSLDFVAFYSSAASVFGSPGQANYTAANAVLDALAWRYRALGVPAVSINWGQWAQGGMAAGVDEHHRDRWAAQGVDAITEEMAHAVFGRVLSGGAPQMLVMPIDWRRYFRAQPAARQSRFLSKVAPGGAGASAPAAARMHGFAESVRTARPEDRYDLLLVHVRDQVMAVLGLSQGNAPSANEGLSQLGMDSLMAMELRNRLQQSLGVPLPSTLAYEHPTVHTLATFLSEAIAPPARPQTARVEKGQEPGTPEPKVSDAALDAMTPTELEASLLDELERAGY